MTAARLLFFLNGIYAVVSRWKTLFVFHYRSISGWSWTYSFTELKEAGDFGAEWHDHVIGPVRKSSHFLIHRQSDVQQLNFPHCFFDDKEGVKSWKKSNFMSLATEKKKKKKGRQEVLKDTDRTSICCIIAYHYCSKAVWKNSPRNSQG